MRGLSTSRRSVRAKSEITIVNELGLHARPAAEFVRQANAFRSEIWLVTERQRYSAQSLIEIMRANLRCGAVAILEAEGPDAAEALEKLAAVVSSFSD